MPSVPELLTARIAGTFGLLPLSRKYTSFRQMQDRMPAIFIEQCPWKVFECKSLIGESAENQLVNAFAAISNQNIMNWLGLDFYNIYGLRTEFIHFFELCSFLLNSSRRADFESRP
jgi:hypothetical protein